jgi:hypothetical protein
LAKQRLQRCLESIGQAGAAAQQAHPREPVEMPQPDAARQCRAHRETSHRAILPPLAGPIVFLHELHDIPQH